MKNTTNKKKVSQAVFVLFIAGLFIIPTSAHTLNQSPSTANGVLSNGGGATVYVDDDNTMGPWDGSLEYPYQFIQDGVDNSYCGDTVYVFAGQYVEPVEICHSVILIGEDAHTTIIDGGNFGSSLRLCADEIVVCGFTITNCGSNPNNAGIVVLGAYNTIVENIIQQNNNYGVYCSGYDNTVYHNNFFENAYPAVDAEANNAWDAGYPCGGNYWDTYSGVDDNEDGMGDTPYPTGEGSADRYPLIHPYGSVENLNTSEIFLTIQGAIDDADTHHGHSIAVLNGKYDEHVHVDKSLTLSGEDSRETIIDARGTGTVLSICSSRVTLQGVLIKNSGSDEENAGILLNGPDSMITDTIIRGNYHGIVLQDVDDAVICRNIIENNQWNGILIHMSCTGNMMYENTISNNFYAGVGVAGASYNYFYHNSFMGNRLQAYDEATNIWDDGYPSGGNYWSDYEGSDANGDGIGDTPYGIPDRINVDRYPLMRPYAGDDSIPPAVEITSPQNGLYLRNHRLFPGLFRQRTILLGRITIDVNASDAQSGIQEVEFYIDNTMQPEFVDTEAPYQWTWTQRSLLHRQHSIIVVAYDTAGNYNVDMIVVWRFL